MNDSFSHIEELTQLCKEKDTFGFDVNAGQTWVYPTNYPVRDYQLNITEKALYQNTMVCLPTGLGKTFIAAVVMYNFYRWYPMGKLIFMAPTKPLVAQQMDACYNIMAIPENVTAEITGTKVIASRANIWKEKRVFFITPQILQNDIDSVLHLAPQIRCIVIDEAHRALGKNANCEAIKKIQNINTNFRVLALTATPGSNFNSVRDVITNLLISHIEVRTNESIDVSPYVFQRQLDTVVIPITGKLLEVKYEFLKILDTYTRPLINNNVFNGNCANFSKGRLVLTMKEYKEKGRHNPNYSFIMRNLNICITLYHGYELLIRHGLRGFLTFFEANISKPLISSLQELHAILEDVSNFLGPVPAIDMLPDGTIPEITGNVVFSHPKFHKLSEILLGHFTRTQDADTRIMVFCEYRESVMEIYTMLLRHRPVVKPRIFLGQGAISQAQQIQTVRMFKSGQCNTLVSTCIGEEGLDVGEVDLIVCFDISTKSPIRMVQRMGRTGRKRDGRVVVLVTEGREQQLLTDCLAQKHNMTSLLESVGVKSCLYQNNPRMIPDRCKPECNKMFITVQQKEVAKKKPGKRAERNTVKSMFANISSSQTSSTSSEIVDDPNELADFSKKWLKSPVKGKSSSPLKKSTNISKKGSKKPVTTKSHDIRNMLSKLNSTQSVATTSTATDDFVKDFSQTTYEPETDNEDPVLTALIENIKCYLSIDVNINACLLCDNLYNCRDHRCSEVDSPTLEEWTVPDESIMEKINFNSLKQFADRLCGSENKFKPEITLNQDITVEPDNLENSLNYFNLDSITDIFSDDGTEIVDTAMETFAQNPIIFTQSFGNFTTPQKSQVTETEPVTTPMQIDDNEDVLVESDTEQSPIMSSFDRILSFKTKIQRKLFSQSSPTPNDNLSKDKEQLNHGMDCHTERTDVTPKKGSEQLESYAVSNMAPEINKNVGFNLTKADKQLNQRVISNTDNIKTISKHASEQIKLSTVSNGELHEKHIDSKLTKSTMPLNHCVNANMVPVENCQIASTNRNASNEQNTIVNSTLNDTDATNYKEHFQIWDESIFETSDIDEGKNFKHPRPVEKLNLRVTENNLHNSSVILDNYDETGIKIVPGDKSYDSNETVMISFDENEFESAQNISQHFETNLSNCNTANVANKSVNLCNKTENSLLSVTQMIDFLNDSGANTSVQPVQKSHCLNKESTVPDKTNVVQKSEQNSIEIKRTSDNSKAKKFANTDTNSSKIIVNKATASKVLAFTGELQWSIKNDENKSKNTWISPNRTQVLWISPKRSQGLCTTTTVSNSQTRVPKFGKDSSKSPITAQNVKTNNKPIENISLKAAETGIKGISNKLKQNLLANEEFDHWNSTIKETMPQTSKKDENFDLSLVEIGKINQNFTVTNGDSANNSQKITNNYDQLGSPTKANCNKSSLAKQNMTLSQEMEVQNILKGLNFSDDSDEEESLLSFSQNSRNSRRKKLKLQLNSTKEKPDTTSKDNNITLSQGSPVKLPKKKVLNCKKTIDISDSDDDFDIKPTWMKPASKITPKKVERRTRSDTSYSRLDIQTTQRIPGAGKSRSQSENEGNTRKIKKTKNPIYEFFDYEASVEKDEHFVPDSQQSQDSDDILESSFINDTQSICDQSDMQAKYLQSIKSPKFGYGAFKIPSKPKVYEDVFSQEVDDQDDTYMNDSFCVDADVTLSQRNQMSYLELAEAELEQRRKTKKRKRILRISDSD